MTFASTQHRFFPGRAFVGTSDKFQKVVCVFRIPEIVLLAQGFAMCAHRNQPRKYENAPYIVHPIRVAHIVAEYTEDPNVIGAAMMHDVLEDTDVTAEEMRRVFGDKIADVVLEVTDVSRPSDGKRAVRKEKDKEHLAKSSPGGATIKLADLIDNCVSIAAHDKGFAPVYLREADALLPVLKHGDERLWERTRVALKEANALWYSLVGADDSG